MEYIADDNHGDAGTIQDCGEVIIKASTALTLAAGNVGVWTLETVNDGDEYAMTGLCLPYIAFCSHVHFITQYTLIAEDRYVSWAWSVQRLQSCTITASTRTIVLTVESDLYPTRYTNKFALGIVDCDIRVALTFAASSDVTGAAGYRYLAFVNNRHGLLTCCSFSGDNGNDRFLRLLVGVTYPTPAVGKAYQLEIGRGGLNFMYYTSTLYAYSAVSLTLFGKSTDYTNTILACGTLAVAADGSFTYTPFIDAASTTESSFKRLCQCTRFPNHLLVNQSDYAFYIGDGDARALVYPATATSFDIEDS